METSEIENNSPSVDNSTEINDNETKMSEIVKLDKRFGRIAIKNNLLTVEQVKDALRKQAYFYKNSNYIIRIGDILVDSGVLGELYRDAILKRQNRLDENLKKHKSFGDIAIEKGFITKEQLETALAYQSNAYKKTREVVFLGDYLLKKELISKEQRDEIVKTRDKYRTESGSNVQKIKRETVSPSEQETSDSVKAEDIEKHDPEKDETSDDTSITQDPKEDDDKLTQETDDSSSDELESEANDNLMSSVKEDQETEEEEDEEDDDDDDEEGEPLNDLNLNENLKISITEDGLEAYLQVKAMLPIRTRLLDLKHYIKESGIDHGLVSNKILKEWIKNKKKRRRPLKIAEGTPPVPPKDSKIVFHFDTGPKKSGTEKKDGSIDYKNRGETLSIKKGGLLAEKIPAEEGKPGLEVTGKIIDVNKPKDINIKSGKGVSRSPDNLYLFAAVNGMPELDQNGRINVHPVLVINGDVGMQTGHILFDGVVLVKGEISPGFQVKAEKLEASSIMNAEIKTAGDVIVKNGIVGAKINARGSVSAKFLKATKIVAKNDVNIQKEIVDCALDIGGKCLCEKGKIVATQIATAQGVKAIQIGSESSASCKIMVGVSAKIQKKLQRLKNTLENSKKDEQAEIRAEISRITSRELSGIPDATADIIVPKDIIGAEIQTRGKIIAGSIKNAVIESLGHVVVQKEIIKTKIQSGGEIIIQNGKVMTSNLIALNGITAIEVGSELSAPCILGFGINESVQERLSIFNKSLESKQRELEQSESLFENYQGKFKQFEIDAQDISWIKKYTKNLSGPMRRKLDSLDNDPPHTRMHKIKEYMGSMDAKMKASDYAKEFRNLRQIQEHMEKYFVRHEKMKAQIDALEERIKGLKSEIKTLQGDIRALSSTSTKNSSAVIKISKAIYSRTELKSANTEMKITQDFGPCEISEVKSSGESGAKIVIQKKGAVPESKNDASTDKKTESKDKNEPKKSNKKDINKITVTGRVMASSGGLAPAGVPSAKVSIKGWVDKKEVNTNTSGEFIIPQLKPGKYKLTVQTKSRPPFVKKLNLKDKKKFDLGDLLLK